MEPELQVTCFHDNLSQEVFVFSHPQAALERTTMLTIAAQCVSTAKQVLQVATHIIQSKLLTGSSESAEGKLQRFISLLSLPQLVSMSCEELAAFVFSSIY